LLLALVGTGILAKVPSVQTTSTILKSTANYRWNVFCLINVTSPLLLGVATGLSMLLKPWLTKLTASNAILLTPAVAITDAPITWPLMHRLAGVSLGQALSKKQLLLLWLALTIAAMLLSVIIDYCLRRSHKLSRLFEFVDRHDLLTVIDSGWNRLLHGCQKHRIGLLTSLYFWALSCLSFVIVSDKLMIQNTIISSTNVFVYLLANKFFVPIVTTLFLWAIFAVFYFITSRYWTAMWLVTVLGLGFSIADKIKMNLRSEPIYPTELKELVNWRSLLSFVDNKLLLVIAAAVIMLFVLLIWLEIKHPVYWYKLKGRIISAVIGVLLLLMPLQSNQKGSPIYYLSRGFNNQPYFMNQKVLTQAHGPILAFLDNIKVPIMTQPSGYSEKKIAQLSRKYQTVARQINRHRSNNQAKQTFVFNLSESFVDPKSFPTVKFKADASDPMPFIRSLSRKTTAGKMLSAGYGGGTANMEWESLTGFSMGALQPGIMPYTQITSRYRTYPTMGMNFAYASAIHPYEGTYYSRISNYHRFGFKKYAYLGSKYKIYDQRKIDRNPYLSDYTCYDNGLRQIKNRPGGQFINLISIQNHMPYNGWYRHNEFKGEASSRYLQQKSYYDSFIDYCKGIQYTDKAVKRFIKQIDAVQKPIIFVFYGDHYPSMISVEDASHYPLQFHETNYFIYANRYARQHGAVKQLKRDKIVNTSDFIALALQQANAKVTPYQALLTKVQQELPAITINYSGKSGLELVDQAGKQVAVSSLSKKQQQLLHDYLLVQYDMTAGKGYSQKLQKLYH
jgi:phosphoglycerol transferase MdoB-like AlkP superfamily enzyme